MRILTDCVPCLDQDTSEMDYDQLEWHKMALDQMNDIKHRAEQMTTLYDQYITTDPAEQMCLALSELKTISVGNCIHLRK